MPSDAEVEAAARAICRIHARNPDHRVIPTDDYVWWQTYESDARAALEAAEAVREREDKLDKRPVAFRVKDFADGWIIYTDEAKAYAEAEATGALMQGLYVRSGGNRE